MPSKKFDHLREVPPPPKQVIRKIKKYPKKVEKIYDPDEVELLRSLEVEVAVVENEGDLKKAAEVLYPEDSNSLKLQKIKRDIQKPYLSSEFVEALDRHGMTMDVVAKKVVGQLTRTEVKYEPIKELVIDENGFVKYVPSLINGIQILMPAHRSAKIKTDEGTFALEREVETPLDNSQKWALEFWERQAIREAPKEVDHRISANKEEVDAFSKVFDEHRDVLTELKRKMKKEGIIQGLSEDAIDAEVIE